MDDALARAVEADVKGLETKLKVRARPTSANAPGCVSVEQTEGHD